MPNFAPDSIFASGYPTTHVVGFYRNKKGKISASKQKHLLWGDWVKIRDADLGVELSALNLNAAELAPIQNDYVPVRVRGVSGYMKKTDLQEERLLEIIFIDVAQGDGALLITPNDKRYVIDAGEHDNMYRFLKWRFNGFKNEHSKFDGFIVTHPDKDHYNGFSALIEDPAVKADNIWHNGLVEQFKVKADGSQDTASEHLLGERETVDGQSYLTKLVMTDQALTDLLSNSKRWIKESTGNPKLYPNLLNKALQATKPGGARRFKNIEALTTRLGQEDFLPGFGPTNSTGCTIEILGPLTEPDTAGTPRLRTFDSKPKRKTTSMNGGKTKNGHSVMLKLNYGKFRLLFGGDLNSSAEMFLLNQYTGIDVYDPNVNWEDVRAAAAPVFEVDIAKACHHGSADFTDEFLDTLDAAATVISSGDEESHAHPRSDTLGAIGKHGRGKRPLIFSTELSRSTKEFTKREDTDWFKMGELTAKIAAESDPAKKDALQAQLDALDDDTRTRNVTSYGAINVRTDGEKVVVAYMLEKRSKSRRWDVYTMEIPDNAGRLQFVPKK